MNNEENEYLQKFSTKLLIKNTDIVESTLTDCNLQIVGLGYTINYSSFDTNIEIVILNGNRLKYNVELKVNLYDFDNEIVCSSSCYIDKDSFNGYDTIVVESSDSDYYKTKSLLNKIKRARIFAVADRD